MSFLFRIGLGTPRDSVEVSITTIDFPTHLQDVVSGGVALGGEIWGDLGSLFLQGASAHRQASPLGPLYFTCPMHALGD